MFKFLFKIKEDIAGNIVILATISLQKIKKNMFTIRADYDIA